eukprot:1663718-Rhodomonas_salina.1
MSPVIRNTTEYQGTGSAKRMRVICQWSAHRARFSSRFLVCTRVGIPTGYPGTPGTFAHWLGGCPGTRVPR